MAAEDDANSTMPRKATEWFGHRLLAPFAKGPHAGTALSSGVAGRWRRAQSGRLSDISRFVLAIERIRSWPLGGCCSGSCVHRQ